MDYYNNHYVQIDTIISQTIDDCLQLIQLRATLKKLPQIACQQTISLVNNIIKYNDVLQHNYDIPQFDIEPLQPIRDTFQGIIKIELQIPEVQEEFITSVTNFFKQDSTIKSSIRSMRSSIKSIRKSSIIKVDKQPQQLYGQMHITFCPIPLQTNIDEFEKDKEQFFRDAFEMKRKQEELVKSKMLSLEKQKQQIKEQIMELKRKNQNDEITYDDDGSIILIKQKLNNQNHLIIPDTKIHYEIQKQNSKQLNTQIQNITNHSILKQPKSLLKPQFLDTMSYQPPQQNQKSTQLQSNQFEFISKEQKLKYLHYDKALRLSKQDYQNACQIQNNLGDMLKLRQQQLTDIQARRTQYIQEYQKSKGITPLHKTEQEEEEINSSIIQIKKLQTEGSININKPLILEDFGDYDNYLNQQLQTIKPKSEKLTISQTQKNKINNELPQLVQQLKQKKINLPNISKTQLNEFNFHTQLLNTQVKKKSHYSKMRSYTTHQ